MVRCSKVNLVGVALICAAALTACGGAAELPDADPSQSPESSSAADHGSAQPGRMAIPCAGVDSIGELTENAPVGTIGIRATIGSGAPAVADLNGGSQTRATYQLKNVSQVAGPLTQQRPEEIEALLAPTSVRVFLPAGDYILVVYPDSESSAWTVLLGLPGQFEVDGDVARQRCMIEGLGVNSTQDEVATAAKQAKRGPLEPMNDVIDALEKSLG